MPSNRTGPREYERVGRAWVGRDERGAVWVASLLPETRSSGGNKAGYVYFQKGAWRVSGGARAKPNPRGRPRRAA
jgi:hypothetical protein